MDEGQRTFGIGLIIAALVGGWLYNTGRVAAVWQAIQGVAVTGSKGTVTTQTVTPAYQTPAPATNPQVITVTPGSGTPLPPELQSEINQLQSYLNPQPNGSFYVA